MKKFLIAAAGTMALAMASQANATQQIYNFTYYQAGYSGSLGTVTVTDHGTATLDIDVLLGSNVWFQMTGNGSLHDDFWFDLSGNPSVTYNITAPNADGVAPGGDYPTGGLFVGHNFSNNAFGQGFLSGFDYVVQDSDSSAGGNLDYYGPATHLTFSVTAASGTLSVNSITSHNISGTNVFFGGDFRQCSGGNPNGTCTTGPAGAVLSAGGVPEPATWAMMLTGFGGMGALLRRRRRDQAAASLA